MLPRPPFTVGDPQPRRRRASSSGHGGVPPRPAARRAASPPRRAARPPNGGLPAATPSLIASGVGQAATSPPRPYRQRRPLRTCSGACISIPLQWCVRPAHGNGTAFLVAVGDFGSTQRPYFQISMCDDDFDGVFLCKIVDDLLLIWICTDTSCSNLSVFGYARVACRIRVLLLEHLSKWACYQLEFTVFFFTTNHSLRQKPTLIPAVTCPNRLFFDMLVPCESVFREILLEQHIMPCVAQTKKIEKNILLLVHKLLQQQSVSRRFDADELSLLELLFLRLLELY